MPNMPNEGAFIVARYPSFPFLTSIMDEIRD